MLYQIHNLKMWLIATWKLDVNGLVQYCCDCDAYAIHMFAKTQLIKVVTTVHNPPSFLTVVALPIAVLLTDLFC